MSPAPSVDGRTILITGATDGLGKRVARDLAAAGATVLLHGRDPRKGEGVLDEIREASGSERLRYYNADLSSLTAVRGLAARLREDHHRLDVLVHNAGIGTGNGRGERETSADGHELRLAVNYLAPLLLTDLLLPLLRRSAPARIVSVASAGQQAIDFRDVQLERHYDGLRAYRQSKLALVMLTFDLAAELEGSGVTANCLHPASLMDTKMVRDTDRFGAPRSSVAEGAHAVEHLIASPELDAVSGEYFDGTEPAPAEPQAYDRAARTRLRELARRWVGLDGRHRIDPTSPRPAQRT